MTRIIVAAALATLALVTPAHAQTKPPVKPAPPQTGVKPATPLPGDTGKIGQPYMLGAKNEELVFTLTGAEYLVSRVMVGIVGNESAVPRAEEKVLLLRFSVQNPQKTDRDFYPDSFTITAVDAADVNHVASFVGRQGASGPVGLQLKPAQKLDVFTALVVPAAGQVPKLIVQRGEGTPVLRFDLRGKVKPLTALFADPADTTGATARPSLAGVAGTFYPALYHDLRFDSAAFSPGPLDGLDAEEGKRFIAATVTFRNASTAPLEYTGGTLKAEFTLASGEAVQASASLLRPDRDAPATGTLRPGDMVTVRLVAQVPADAAMKSLRLQEGEESRAYIFDLSAVK